MREIKSKISGQNLTEVALCLAVLSTAILGMRIYVQRSLQARYKQGADFVLEKIEEEALNQGLNLGSLEQQYDPYYHQSNITENRNAAQTKYKEDGELEEGEVWDGAQTLDSTTNRTGWTSVGSALD